MKGNKVTLVIGIKYKGHKPIMEEIIIRRNLIPKLRAFIYHLIKVTQGL